MELNSGSFQIAPINTDFLEAVHDAAEGVPAQHTTDLKEA